MYEVVLLKLQSNLLTANLSSTKPDLLSNTFLTSVVYYYSPTQVKVSTSKMKPPGHTHLYPPIVFSQATKHPGTLLQLHWAVPSMHSFSSKNEIAIPISIKIIVTVMILSSYLIRGVFYFLQFCSWLIYVASSNITGPIL